MCSNEVMSLGSQQGGAQGHLIPRRYPPNTHVLNCGHVPQVPTRRTTGDIVTKGSTHQTRMCSNGVMSLRSQQLNQDFCTHQGAYRGSTLCGLAPRLRLEHNHAGPAYWRTFVCQHVDVTCKRPIADKDMCQLMLGPMVAVLSSYTL